MLEAKNDAELIKALEEIDIDIPLRSEGRTKGHTERYAVAHLLSALVGTKLITYPISLAQRERPDFLLSMDTTQIGIEHTEAVPQNEAHKTVLREKGNGPDVYFISRNKPGELKKKANKLIEEIEANDPGDGWAEDSVELEWADAMFYFVKQKIEKLLKDGFARFNQDWLLIYDNWSLLSLELKKAVTLLMGIVNENKVLKEFEHVFIITGKHICDISCTGIQLYDIHDLWS